MPINLPIDFTKSPLERLIEIANSPIEQNMLDSERTSVTEVVHRQGEDNSSIYINHDRVGDGLPAGVELTGEQYEDKEINFTAIYFDPTDPSQEVQVGLRENQLTAVNVFGQIGQEYGYTGILESDLTEAFTPVAGVNKVTFNVDSLKYSGTLVINIGIQEA